MQIRPTLPIFWVNKNNWPREDLSSDLTNRGKRGMLQGPEFLRGPLNNILWSIAADRFQDTKTIKLYMITYFIFKLNFVVPRTKQ